MLEELLSSEVRADLLLLFRKNPGLIDSLDAIARRIGRTANSISEDMKYLVQLGVIRSKQIGKTEVFLLDHARDKEVQEMIGKYLSGLNKTRGA